MQASDERSDTTNCNERNFSHSSDLSSQFEPVSKAKKQRVDDSNVSESSSGWIDKKRVNKLKKLF